MKKALSFFAVLMAVLCVLSSCIQIDLFKNENVNDDQSGTVSDDNKSDKNDDNNTYEEDNGENEDNGESDSGHQTDLNDWKEEKKKEGLSQAESLAQKSDYIAAIRKLKDLLQVIPGDDEIESKITVYEKNYVLHVLSEADKVFVTPSADYKKALSIINTALQYCPNDSTLKSKKEYYSSYEPKNLYDMNVLRGTARKFSTDADFYGNTYEKCFYSGYYSMVYAETDATYYLDSKYNTFDAVVYGHSNSSDSQAMIVEIYGDDVVLYRNSEVLDNKTKPFSIHLDVTGVSELRIVLKHNYGAVGRGIGMTDMYLKKTVK